MCCPVPLLSLAPDGDRISQLLAPRGRVDQCMLSRGDDNCPSAAPRSGLAFRHWLAIDGRRPIRSVGVKVVAVVTVATVVVIVRPINLRLRLKRHEQKSCCK